MDDSSQKLRLNVVDNEREGVERRDSNADVEIVDELWQGIFMNKWIVVVHVRNNSNTR